MQQMQMKITTHVNKLLKNKQHNRGIKIQTKGYPNFLPLTKVQFGSIPSR